MNVQGILVNEEKIISFLLNIFLGVASLVQPNFHSILMDWQVPIWKAATS